MRIPPVAVPAASKNVEKQYRLLAKGHNGGRLREEAKEDTQRRREGAVADEAVGRGASMRHRRYNWGL